jgi:hypothetical protein
VPYDASGSDSDPSDALQRLIACAVMADLVLPDRRLASIAGTSVNPDRFDTLTRTVGTTRSRRAALGTLLAGTLDLLDLVETSAKQACPPCMKRKHGKCKATKHLNDTACSGGTCRDGRCLPTEDQPRTCPLGKCSRKKSCGPGCACLAIGGGTHRCLALGTCSGRGRCEWGTCGADCTCVNPGGSKARCVSTAGCPEEQCTADADCGSACRCVGVGNAARCASIVPSS